MFVSVPAAATAIPREPRTIRRGRSSAAAGLRGLTVVRLVDRRHELVLVHLRPTRDVELAGELHEVLLARVRIDATGRLAVALSRGRAAFGRLLVRRALLLLGFPVVGDLL